LPVRYTRERETSQERTNPHLSQKEKDTCERKERQESAIVQDLNLERRKKEKRRARKEKPPDLKEHS